MRISIKKIGFCIIAVLQIVACQKSNQRAIIKNVDWLIGKWENKSNQGKLVEIWKKQNDSVFIGKSYFIKMNDTLHQEELLLKQKGENLLYISTIKGENNNNPLIFIQNTEITNQFSFENSKNNYPKKIVYKPLNYKQLIIEISGIENNKPSTINYSLKKTKIE